MRVVIIIVVAIAVILFIKKHNVIKPTVIDHQESAIVAGNETDNSSIKKDTLKSDTQKDTNLQGEKVVDENVSSSNLDQKETTPTKNNFTELASASSFSEALQIIKDIFSSKSDNTESSTEEPNNDLDFRDDESHNPDSNQSDNTSSQNAEQTTVPKQDPVLPKKESMVIVLPINNDNTTSNSSGNLITIKSATTSNALLSVCKTQYPGAHDVRVINQTSVFNIATKSAESMTFEVECL